MGRQHAVVEHQIDAWARYERCELLEQLERLEHELAGAVHAWERNGSRKYEGVSDLIANPPYCLVAGAGFEPATFGL